MIDDQLIDMLISDNVAERKQAVKKLAQSKNREALPYLADVFQNDEDAEVRELARKGGIYIKRNVPESSAPVQSLYADDNEEDEEEEVAPTSAPLPSEIHVSKAQADKAQGFVQQALDQHMRGDNEKASQLLNKALQANPRLMHDGYTISLAATVTGMPGPEAIQLLAPTGDELQKRKATSPTGGGDANRPSGIQSLLAVGVMIAATVVLVGYLLFPWIDISSVPASNIEGSPSLGDAWDTQIEEFNLIFEGADGELPDEINDVVNALRAVHWDLSGLNASLLTNGMNDVIESFGMNRIVDLTAEFGVGLGDLGLQSELDLLSQPFESEGLDLALFLVPVSSVIALILAITLMMRSSIALWIVLILVGLSCIAPMVYFFTIGEATLRDKIDWLSFLEITQPDQSLLALGFWVSLIGGLLLIILPFIAILSVPVEDNSPAPAADRL